MKKWFPGLRLETLIFNLLCCPLNRINITDPQLLELGLVQSPDGHRLYVTIPLGLKLKVKMWVGLKGVGKAMAHKGRAWWLWGAANAWVSHLTAFAVMLSKLGRVGNSLDLSEPCSLLLGRWEQLWKRQGKVRPALLLIRSPSLEVKERDRCYQTVSSFSARPVVGSLLDLAVKLNITAEVLAVRDNQGKVHLVLGDCTHSPGSLQITLLNGWVQRPNFSHPETAVWNDGTMGG